MKKFSLFIFTIFLGGLLISCGNTSPKNVVNNYFKEVSKGDISNVSNYLNGKIEDPSLNMNNKENNDSKEQSEISKEAEKIVFTKLEVKTGKEVIDGNTATVEVTVKGINLSDIFAKYMKMVLAETLQAGFSGKSIDEEQMLKDNEGKYLQMVKDAKPEERTGKITLTKVDNNWKIDVNKEFTQLLFGQLTSNR